MSILTRSWGWAFVVGILGAVLVVLLAVPSAVAPAGPERPALTVAEVDDGFGTDPAPEPQ